MPEPRFWTAGQTAEELTDYFRISTTHRERRFAPHSAPLLDLERRRTIPNAAYVRQTALREPVSQNVACNRPDAG